MNFEETRKNIQWLDAYASIKHQKKMIESMQENVTTLELLNNKGLIEGHRLALERIQIQTQELLDFIVDDLLFEAEREDESVGVNNVWLRQELIDLNIIEEDHVL